MAHNLEQLIELNLQGFLDANKNILKSFPQYYDRVKKVREKGGVTFKGINSGVWSFDVASGTKSGKRYSIQMSFTDISKLIPSIMSKPGMVDSTGKVNWEKVANELMLEADILIVCDDPSDLYWGGHYLRTKLGAKFGSPESRPITRAQRLFHCKHIQAVLSRLHYYLPEMIDYLKRYYKAEIEGFSKDTDADEDKEESDEVQESISYIDNVLSLVEKEVNKSSYCVQETTTSAAISYLPSNLFSIKPVVDILLKRKKTWGVDVLDTLDECIEVCFEGVASIKVEKKHWQQFVTEVFGKDYKFEDKDIDLSHLGQKLLEENDIIDEESIEAITYDVFSKFPYEDIINDTILWKSLFGVIKYEPSDVIIRIDKLNDDIKKFAVEVNDNPDKDRIIRNLQDREPVVPYYSTPNKNLLGTTIKSKYNDVDLTFDAYINQSSAPAESIYIDDEKVVAELKRNRFFQISNNKIFPFGGLFKESDFKNIKNVIDIVGGS